MTTKRKTAKRQTRALAVVKRKARAFPAKRTPKALEKAPDQPKWLEALDDRVQMGNFGLAELKFTPEEESKFAQPIAVEEVRILPTGQVYASHPTYTKRLNEAFGRTGWALVPTTKPLIAENMVAVHYLLCVHGQAIAHAWGYQEYFPNNKDQNYGDAVEATVASALRRCTKHLGLFPELWDRGFGEAYKAEYCVRVSVEGRDRWRRRVDPPLPKESSASMARQTSHGRQPQRRETIEHDPQGSETITNEQRMQFVTAARTRGRTDDEVKAYLVKGWNVAGTSAIKRKDLEAITRAVLASGPLPMTMGTREPGQEG